jgi:hypothetical protein
MPRAFHNQAHPNNRPNNKVTGNKVTDQRPAVSNPPQPAPPLLTTQPFQPKLTPTIVMTRGVRYLPYVALLLGIIFLGAQLHFCADVTSAPTGTHICPVCSAVGAAVVTPTVSILVVSVVKPLELSSYVVASTSEIPRDTSPRAPPAL